jgi:hypothetical protein
LPSPIPVRRDLALKYLIATEYKIEHRVNVRLDTGLPEKKEDGWGGIGEEQKKHIYLYILAFNIAKLMTRVRRT